MVKLTEAQEKERQAWQYRAVERTRGNQTLLGCIILSVIGRPAKNPPRVGALAKIDLLGNIRTGMTNGRGVDYEDCLIGTVKQVADQFNRLADDLKFSDEDRLAMFAELQKWIEHDERALLIGPDGRPLQ